MHDNHRPVPELGNSSKILWWIIGTLTSAVLAVGGTTIRQVDHYGQRLSVLETQQQHVSKQLERIEGKVDRLGRPP